MAIITCQTGKECLVMINLFQTSFGNTYLGRFASFIYTVIMHSQELKVLSQCPLFKNLQIDEVQAFADAAKLKRFNKGESLFVAQSLPEGLHIVSSGKVKIFIISPDSGRELILTIEKPFQAVAELPCFDGGRYPANAEAMEATQTLFIGQSKLEYLLSTRPNFALHFLRVFGRRLRTLVRLVESLSFQTVMHRLVDYLKRRANSELPFLLESNSSIAAQLGTVPELVSRNLAHLQNAGAIQLEDRKVIKINQSILNGFVKIHKS